MIVTTIINRPYVVLFLIAFLFFCWRQRGGVQTLIFLFTGYLIAWASEALSIRTGFPYGWYFYIHENLKGEWLNWGVPVWDSVSYVFLCFAGLSVAEFVLVPSLCKGGLGRVDGRRIKLTLLAAFFTTLLDIIIDPLAHMGDQWFLGKIYYYPDPGFYFDVPLSNFAGWFLVSFLIVGVWGLIEAGIKKLEARKKSQIQISKTQQGTFLLNDNRNTLKNDDGTNARSHDRTIAQESLFLYFGIFLFNWIITIWLHQWLMALCDLFWIAIPAVLVGRKWKNLKTKT